MRQHAINLMPESIRERSLAGARMNQLVLAVVACLAVFLVTSMHSLFVRMSAQDALFETSAKAEEVFAIEAKSAELKILLRRAREFTQLYERVALPLDVSAVIATVVNDLPPSVTLDQIDIDSGARALSRSPRTKGLETKDDHAARVMTGEVSGFACSDQEIAELVSRLDGRPPFRDVSLDFSRTKLVHNRQPAREFRLSFKIDLDSAYQVAGPGTPQTSASAKERGDD